MQRSMVSSVGSKGKGRRKLVSFPFLFPFPSTLHSKDRKWEVERMIYRTSSVAGRRGPRPWSPCDVLSWTNKVKKEKIRGSVRDRHPDNIFAHCALIFYFRDFKFSNVVCPYERHPLTWFFFKKSFRIKKNVQKTAQNALAPSIFIVLSIMLKLATPLLHTQAQNSLLQNF